MLLIKLSLSTTVYSGVCFGILFLENKKRRKGSKKKNKEKKWRADVGQLD